MKKDYIITFITEFIVLASGILVYKLAANILGKDGFSEYALSRRTVSLIQPLLLMGLAVGIPRYIAYASTNFNNKSDTYFIAGMLILVITTLIFMLILNFFDYKFAFLLFGNHNYVYLIFPISLMLIGLVFHSSCYSYFRGKLSMISANMLQIINMGIIPPIFFLFGKNTKQIILITGISWIIVSVIFIGSTLPKLTFNHRNLFLCVKELLLYGLQRIPGDFAMASFFSLPAVFTSHISGIREAGFVAFGTSLLNMIGATFAPLSIILLPKVSEIVAKNDFGLLKYYVVTILKISVFFTITGIVFFLIFGDKIIKLYLGKVFSDIVLITKIIVIASIPYVIYISMRSIIDAFYVKAVNTINIILSLLFFLFFSGIGKLFNLGYIAIVISFTISIFILGILTLLETQKVLLKNNAI